MRNNESLFLCLLFHGVQGHVLQGLHDSLSVFIFQIKSSDEEACTIITNNSTATLCEIHATKATGKLNMPLHVGGGLIYPFSISVIFCDILPTRHSL